MKKNIIIAFILVLTMLLGACGGVAPTPPAPQPAESPPMPTHEPAADYAPAPAPEAVQQFDYYREYDWSADGESYLFIDENRETFTEHNSMLTFSLKVDTAAYTNVQR